MPAHISQIPNSVHLLHNIIYASYNSLYIVFKGLFNDLHVWFVQERMKAQSTTGFHIPLKKISNSKVCKILLLS